jgi:hypothetical protein
LSSPSCVLGGWSPAALLGRFVLLGARRLLADYAEGAGRLDPEFLVCLAALMCAENLDGVTFDDLVFQSVI